MSRPLCVFTAKAVLAEPLRFGNEDQVAALKILAEVAECIQAIKTCPHESRALADARPCASCKERGLCVCEECGYEHMCGHCGGAAVIETLCECIMRFPHDVVSEAIDQAEAGLDKLDQMFLREANDRRE